MEHFTEMGYRQPPSVHITCPEKGNVQQNEVAQMHWDIAKLLSLGVSEEFLMEDGVTPPRARELLKGLLYLRERYASQ